MIEPAAPPIDSAAPLIEPVEITGPVRTCVGCRTAAPQTGLLRFVLVEGVVAADPGHRLPGRGAWLHDSDECWALAERKHAFDRAFRARRRA